MTEQDILELIQNYGTDKCKVKCSKKCDTCKLNTRVHCHDKITTICDTLISLKHSKKPSYQLD